MCILIYLRSFIHVYCNTLASNQGDEPSSDITTSHSRSLQHFDHNFKGELHTAVGAKFVEVFGECSFAKRGVSMTCKGNSFEVVEEIGLTSKKQVEVMYTQVIWIPNTP